MVRLSVIIPVYNVEAYIASCLDSILGYTGDDIEIIAVVDGSKDRSEEILNEYANKDGRLHVFVQENQGVSTARNKGLELASGQYLMFVDGDDWIDTNSLEMIVKFLNDHSGEAELILTDYVEASGKGEKKKALELPDNPELETIYQLAVSGSKMNFCWGKIYITDIIKNNQISFRKDVKIGEDIIFVMDYLEYVTKTTYLSQYLYYYRQNLDSVMRTVNINRFNEMKYSYERREQFCKAHHLTKCEEDMHVYYRRAIYIYLKQIQEMPQGVKEKCNIIKEVIQIPLIRQILLGEKIVCQTKWQRHIKRAVSINAPFFIWYILRKVNMQDIFQN